MGILQLKPKGLETRHLEVTEREKDLDMLVATWVWATTEVWHRNGKGKSSVASGSLFSEMCGRSIATVWGCRDTLPGVLLRALATHAQVRWFQRASSWRQVTWSSLLGILPWWGRVSGKVRCAMGAGVRKSSRRWVWVWEWGVQGSTGANTMLSYQLSIRDIGLRDWSVREMQEEIAEDIAKEFATDNVEGDILTNFIACRSFFF